MTLINGKTNKYVFDKTEQINVFNKITGKRSTRGQKWSVIED